MNFSLFGKKNETQNEEPQIKLTEQMLINDLPQEISDEFVTTFQKSSDFKNVAPLSRGSEIESTLQLITEGTLAAIDGPLMAVAHLIDSGKDSVNDFSTELTRSTSDLNNSSHVRTTPTPFIIRSVERIERRSVSLSQALAAYESRMMPISKEDPIKILKEFLKQENHALIRSSGRIVNIRSKYETLKTNYQHKLRIPSLTQLEEIPSQKTTSTCADGIKSRLAQYFSERKRKEEKLRQTTDLFGASTLPPPPAPSKLGGFSGLRTTGTLGSSTTKPNAPGAPLSGQKGPFSSK